MSQQEAFERTEKLIRDYLSVKRSNSIPGRITELQAHDSSFEYDPHHDLVREGLVEHVGLLPILATTLYPYVASDEIDLGEALTILAIHDIGETVTGDTNTFIKTDSEADEEQEIAKKLLDPMYLDLYELGEDPSTPSSRFAKSMDKLVAEYLDYICPPEVTLKRYAVMLDLNTPDEIIDKKLSHKGKYFEWHPFLKEHFAHVLEVSHKKLSS